jgi:hypothetical protein
VSEMVTKDVQLPTSKNRLNKCLGLAFAIALLVANVMVLLSENAKDLQEISNYCYNALNAIDPFVLTRCWWNHSCGGETIENIVKGGWLLLALFAVSMTVVFLVFGDYAKDGVQRIFAAIVLSGLVAVPLKWALMILTAGFGAAMGFIVFINISIVAGSAAVALHVYHVRKSARDVRKAAKEAAEAFKMQR